jgi:apolipoprotein N-acyltransferase
MSRKKNYLLSILSGCLFFLSWPPYGFPFLLFIAFIPLLQVEHAFSSNSISNKQTSLFGVFYIAFFIWNLSTTWWIYKASVGGAAMAIFANSFIMAAVMWLFHLIKKRLLAGGWKQQTANFIFIFFWLGYEFFHYRWELTWPWLALGNAFASVPSCVQWYEYTGTCGGSLWVLAINLSLFGLWKNKPLAENYRAQAGKIILMLIAPIAISLLLYYTYLENENPANIVIVQPNIDPYSEKFSGMNYAEQLEKLLNLAKLKVDSATDYLVCPETALTEDIWENSMERTSSIHRLKEFLKPYPKLKIIAGAATAYLYKEGERPSVTARKFSKQQGYYDVFNTAFQLDNSDSIQFYHKSKLVPGVERMPYPAVFGFLEKWSIDLGGTSGSLGTQEGRTVFADPRNFPEKGASLRTQKSSKRVNGPLTIAPVICYESIFGEFVSEYVSKGASLIFIITNDGWWGNTPGFRQHLLYGRLRAIETRRSIARSGNTGISCFINQRGDIIQSTAWWKPDVIKGVINRNSRKTFYVRNGDIIGRVSCCISILLLIYAGVPYLLRRTV